MRPAAFIGQSAGARLTDVDGMAVEAHAYVGGRVQVEDRPARRNGQPGRRGRRLSWMADFATAGDASARQCEQGEKRQR